MLSRYNSIDSAKTGCSYHGDPIGLDELGVLTVTCADSALYYAMPVGTYRPHHQVVPAVVIPERHRQPKVPTCAKTMKR